MIIKENGEINDEYAIDGKRIRVHCTYSGLTEEVIDSFNKLLAGSIIEDYEDKTNKGEKEVCQKKIALKKPTNFILTH